MIDARPLVLRPLPYPYEALAPALSEEQVRAHYERHHAAYVRKANTILEGVGGTLEGFGKAPTIHWERFLFNRNGVLLHELFWDSFIPGGTEMPQFLGDQIGHDFFALRRDLVHAHLGLMGSGWICLSMSRTNGDLSVHTVKDHSYPWDKLEPLLVIDGWEHSYYLDYLNEKARYTEGLLSLVNWTMVEWRLLGRQGKPTQPGGRG